MSRKRGGSNRAANSQGSGVSGREAKRGLFFFWRSADSNSGEIFSVKCSVLKGFMPVFRMVRAWEGRGWGGET